MDPLPPLESPALSPKVFPFLYLGDPGIRNAYFLGVAGLTLMGYLTLTLHLNLALFAAALLRLRPRALSAFYGTVWWTLALLLVYHESFLPPPSALTANAADLSDFSVSFILDFLKSAVNRLCPRGAPFFPERRLPHRDTGRVCDPHGRSLGQSP